jgi:hypothetical protein
MSDVSITIVIGSSRAISTSKIKKITAIRKNRNENGNRADFLGSNPHSKGDLFFSSSVSFFDSSDVISIMIIDRSRATADVIIIVVIVYLVE